MPAQSDFDPHQHKRGAQKVCELAEIYTHALLCTEHRQKPNEVAKMAFQYAAATVELRNEVMRDANKRDQEAAALADVDSSITLGEAQADTDARAAAGEAVSAPVTEPAPPLEAEETAPAAGDNRTWDQQYAGKPATTETAAVTTPDPTQGAPEQPPAV